MPLRNPSSKTTPTVRQLKKTPPLKLNSPTEATALITAVQTSLNTSTTALDQQQQRRVLAIINPASGRGVAPTVFSKHIKPVLQAAGMILTEATTTSRGHATQILKKVLPNEFDLILSLGGDGTMFEVLQGVLQRPDWEAMSTTTTLLQIPCGSGNALAASTGLWDVPTAAHAAVKGQKTLLDIASVVQTKIYDTENNGGSRTGGRGGRDGLIGQQEEEENGPVRFFSFLSCTYGMLSCLDIGTEHLRWMGSTRFIVGAIQQIIMQHTFKIKVAYLDADRLGGDNNTGGGGGDTTHNNITRSDRIDNLEDGLDGTVPSTLHGWHGITETVGYGPALQHLKEFSPIITTSLSSRNSTAANTTATTSPTAASQSASASPSSLPLLPPGWHWLPADTIQLFAACNLPQLDMNFKFAPDATLHSGHFNLIYTTGKSGWLKGFSLLTAAEKGEHMHLVQQRKLKAYWIEPLAASGSTTWLVCDGEEVPHQPLYAEVHQGLITTLKAPDIRRTVEVTRSS
jgi:sphingosine kinase